DATGISKGFRSLQKSLNTQADEFFQPIIDTALDPVANALYDKLAQQYAANPANFVALIKSAFSDVQNDLLQALAGINGAGNKAQTVLGTLNQAMLDVDDTIGLMIRLLEKDTNGDRHVVRILIQKLVSDEGPIQGFIGSLGDDIV